MSGERYSGTGAENDRRHESLEIFEMLDTIKQIEAVISWLVESGPGTNPLVRSMKRARLHSLYQQLGIDPDDPQALTKVLELSREVNDRVLHPQPQTDIPEIAFFEERIPQIIGENKGNQGPVIFENDSVDLMDVVLFGHTDWDKVRSRTMRRTDGEYMHGVATVMADPIAYHGTFLSREIAGRDIPAIDKYWGVQNGRHRSLAAKCLGPDFVRESGMNNWVEVSIEP